MRHIDITPRTLHFKQPAGTSRGVYLERHIWLLTLTDDDLPGRQGLGECAPLPRLSCDDLPQEEYETLLRGFCDTYCRTGTIPYPALRPYPSMLFGLETAVLDLEHADGRFFDTPFARGEEGIPINGLVWMGTHDEMAARIEEKLRAGFHCVKLKIGAIDFYEEESLIRHIRERFDSKTIELRLDANGAFKPDDALLKLERLSRYDIHSIEQPIRQGQWEAMARLCRLSPIPIALDEELIEVIDPSRKTALLQEVHPAYIILKPSLHGGMRGTREWIETAARHGVGTWITSALESNVGLNAIAQLAAQLYGPDIRMPQGLGTGQLFTDNLPMPLQIEGDRLWRKA